MKTFKEVSEASRLVAEMRYTPGLSAEQGACLAGMADALLWVMDAGGFTVERLVRGEKPVTEKADESV